MKRLQEMVNELNTTNSTNKKQEILAKYEDCKEYLKIIYSSFAQFHVTSKNIIKMSEKLISHEFLPVGNLMHLLTVLSQRQVTGHEALRTAQAFIEKNQEYKELILNAIDKNLKCRIDAKMINKVFPKCVPVWDVALAQSLHKVANSAKPDFENDTWYVSRKLDGVRCICVRMGDDVKFYSRTGKEFLTLDVIRKEILKLPLKNFVLDGEMCLFNGELEDFQGMMKEIRKKDHQINNPRYKIFDMLDIDEFLNRESTTNLTFRLNAIAGLLINYNGLYLEKLEQTQVDATMDIQSLLEEADKKGWEGLILRKDTTYKGKRSNDILKCKLFYEDEYRVESIESEPIRWMDEDENGVKFEKEDVMMARANIIHKGNVVGVGSGWSILQRIEFHNNPEKIVGKIITVQYKKETTNKDGKKSLQFPTVKVIHGDKREI